MKIRSMAIATVLAFAVSLAAAPAQAHNYRHYHHHHTIAQSGPTLDGGGVDHSRVGGQGVSRKAAD